MQGTLSAARVFRMVIAVMMLSVFSGSLGKPVHASHFRYAHYNWAPQVAPRLSSHSRKPGDARPLAAQILPSPLALCRAQRQTAGPA
jgi:hypothetical protein